MIICLYIFYIINKLPWHKITFSACNFFEVVSRLHDTSSAILIAFSLVARVPPFAINDFKRSSMIILERIVGRNPMLTCVLGSIVISPFCGTQSIIERVWSRKFALAHNLLQQAWIKSNDANLLCLCMNFRTCKCQETFLFSSLFYQLKNGIYMIGNLYRWTSQIVANFLASKPVCFRIASELSWPDLSIFKFMPLKCE